MALARREIQLQSERGRATKEALLLLQHSCTTEGVDLEALRTGYEVALQLAEESARARATARIDALERRSKKEWQAATHRMTVAETRARKAEVQRSLFAYHT